MPESASGAGGGGGSPFGAPGLSVGGNEGPAPNQGGGGQPNPLAGNPIPPSQRQAPPPQRGRMEDFAPHSRSNRAEVLDAPDMTDPFAPLVNQALQGTRGQELARRSPAEITDDAEATRVQSELDAEAHAEGQGFDEQPYEAQATVIGESDWAHLREDPRFQELLAARDERAQWVDSDHLPESFYSKFIPIEMPPDAQGRPGRRINVDANELRRSYLRQSDYTNKLRDLYAQADQVAERERGMQRIVNVLGSGDGQAFLKLMAYMEAMPAFHQAALIYGYNLAQEEQMPPEQRQLLAHSRQLETQLERERVEREAWQARALQAQQTQQQASPPPDVQHFLHQLERMLPEARRRMEAAGRPYIDSKLTDDLLLREWDTFIRTHQGDLTTGAIQEVLTGVMEQVEQYGHAGYIPAPATPASTQLPPATRQSPAPGRNSLQQQAGAPQYGSQNGRRETRARIGDLNFINQRGRQ